LSITDTSIVVQEKWQPSRPFLIELSAILSYPLRGFIEFSVAFIYSLGLMEVETGKVISFRLGTLQEKQRFVDFMVKTFPVETETQPSQRRSFYDTFDWRVHEENYLFFRRESEFHLQPLDPDSITENQIWDRPAPPEFWWDFPPSPFRDRLKSIVDVRALIMLLQIESQTTVLRIMNDDGKMLTRFEISDLKVVSLRQDPALLFHAVCQPVRGYEKDCADHIDLLKNEGFEIEDNPTPALTLGLREIGRSPGDYSSKFSVILLPDETIHSAAKKIIGSLLSTLRANESGIRSDLDTEFLHDFRVASRRIRSAVSQIKGAFDADIHINLNTDMRFIGTLTNRLRDLDVYLLSRNRFQEMLPDNLRAGLDSFFHVLKEQRQTEIQKVRTHLDSSEYHSILDRWSRLFKPGNDQELPAGTTPCEPVILFAKRIITKRFKNVMKTGRLITGSSPSADLHRLRIQCKKLRYLLEFFHSLFPEEQMKVLEKHLKDLQTVLGDFNDLSIQKRFLENVLVTGSRTRKSMDLFTSLGGLIAMLYNQRNIVRDQFHNTFDSFRKKTNRKLYRSLFGSES
jgi:CHAD domain-containing protein